MTVETAAATSRRWPWQPWAGAALALLLLVLVYHRTVAVLWRTWHGNDNYSHGPLVPLVSVALAWLARDRWRAAPATPDTRGLALVAFACLLQVAGVRSDIFALECYSIVVMAFGLCLTFQGSARTRVMAFPLGFLAFMMVFPPLVVMNLSYALKEFTVAVAVRLAEACGVILQRSGMTIFLTDGRIRIENPCSGLRSLVALLATGAVFAYLQPGGWLSRAALCLAAVPLAMIGNALRITLILLVAHYVGVKEATGTFHDRSGYVVYCLALLGLVLIRRALAPRSGPEPLPA